MTAEQARLLLEVVAAAQAALNLANKVAEFGPPPPRKEPQAETMTARAVVEMRKRA